MASGNIVAALGPSRPVNATSAATPDVVNGGATPAESACVHDFDATTDEFVDFYGRLHGYGGGGLTVKFAWSASSGTSNAVVWAMAIRRVQDDAEDFDTTAHSYAYNTTTATAPSAVGELSYDTVTFTDGADMDSLADGECFVLRVSRDADNGSDTMAGDAELWPDMLLVTET